MVENMATLMSMLSPHIHPNLALLSKSTYTAFKLNLGSLSFRHQQYERLKQYFLTKFVHSSKAKARLIPSEFKN